MTLEGLRRIETSLGVTLPPDYRRLMLNYPVVFDRGTAEGDLWDEADAVVRRNEELRRPRRSLGAEYRALPARYLFVGDDGAGWQHLLDLESDPPVVHIMEYEAVASIRPARSDDDRELPLNVWLHDRLVAMRDGGIDITAPNHPSSEGTWGCVAVTLVLCVLTALACALMVVGIESLRGR